MTADIPFCPPPHPQPSTPQFTAPAGAIDCHAHVFGPESAYPFSPARGYTPPDAPINRYLTLLDTLGIARGVLTQPSVYATDNQAMLDAIAVADGRLRGVVAVDADASDRELETYNAVGCRGVRVNLADPGGNPFDSFAELRQFAERLAPLGWHVELLIHVNSFPDLYETLSGFPVPIVVGHLGYMKLPETVNNPGFQEFLTLVRDGNCWVKLTGTYRITGEDAPPYPDVTPIAQALIDANPDRLLWGTDWPHPHHYRGMPDDAYLLDQMTEWTDAATLHKILCENPVALYGFD